MNQAVQELPTDSLGTYVIPTEIDAKAAENHYWLVCVKATDSKDKMSKIFSYKTRVIHINQWNKITRQVSKGIFKQPFGDIFNKVVVLHNPTLAPAPLKKEEPKKKGLSPTIKSKIKALHLEGKEAETIATELEKDLELVSAYIADKL